VGWWTLIIRLRPTLVDCRLVWFVRTENKCLRLNRLDAWWTVDWYGSIEQENKRLRLNRLDAWWTVDWYGSFERRTSVCALTGFTLGGLWTGMDRPFHFDCSKSDQPARHVFSQRWFDCSSRTSHLGTPSLKATYMVWMISASRLHAPGTDKLHFHSTRGRTENR